jgi:Tol biopolymer transport system component
MTVNVQSRKTNLLLDDNLTDPQDASTGRTAATPSWSDDGKTIYYAWSYPGSPYAPDSSVQWKTDLSITACSASGPCNSSTAKTLTKPYFETGGDSEPAPRLADPNYMVYTQWQYQTARDGTSRSLASLQALNLNTTSQVTLTALLDNNSEPAWSPNGRYLAFVKTSDDLQSSSIWVMSFHPPGRITDYGKARLLVKGDPFAEHPVFSPDGKYLAYVAATADGRLHLFIARVDLGPAAHAGAPQMVQRAGIVDGDNLVWTTA